MLLVEDEPALLHLGTTMLEKLGYRVLAADTPGEAIRLAEEHAGAIHLLMTDVVMPEMNDRDLARRLLSLYPNLRRLFMSGYTASFIQPRQNRLPRLSRPGLSRRPARDAARHPVGRV